MFVHSVLIKLHLLLAAFAPPAPAATLCHLQDNRILEASGVAVGKNVIWTHNDSGDIARFFALDRHCHTLATYDVTNETATDWEDMARGAGALWLGDIGDNNGNRKEVEIVKVPEPTVTRGEHRVKATVLHLHYADGPQDAETLLVDPVSGELFVITKSFNGWAGVYAVRGNVLTKVNYFHLSQTGTRGGPAGPLGQVAVTSGDINPSVTRVVLRTYTDAYEWTIRGGDVAGAFTSKPVRTALPPTTQGEGIAYDTDGRSWITTSEGKASPVERIPR
jgi:hypothetical protein